MLLILWSSLRKFPWNFSEDSKISQEFFLKFMQYFPQNFPKFILKSIFFMFLAIFSMFFRNFSKKFQKLQRKFFKMSLKLHHIFPKIFTYSLKICLKITLNFYWNVIKICFPFFYHSFLILLKIFYNIFSIFFFKPYLGSSLYISLKFLKTIVKLFRTPKFHITNEITNRLWRNLRKTLKKYKKQFLQTFKIFWRKLCEIFEAISGTLTRNCWKTS